LFCAASVGVGTARKKNEYQSRVIIQRIYFIGCQSKLLLRRKSYEPKQTTPASPCALNEI
ncbi:hypothetical protein, partial [uncultured Psychrobacter sp.]|uniref:hypothetical protein n=1 Tax=uncultured Psychrobacter sp. TaxID=259303 RepID=UPI00261C94B4